MCMNNNLIINKLKKFINNGTFDYIMDAGYNDCYLKTLMFPTDDLHLTKEQFESLTHLLNDGETIYVMQMAWDMKDGFFDINNQCFQLKSPIEYSEYASLELYTISLLVPTQFNWIVLVEENLDNGEALFIGDKKVTEQFRQIYSSNQDDLAKYVLMWLSDYKNRNVKLDYLERVLGALSN